MSLEELGPTFVKFGQLLATRPDLIPEDFVQEFKKLQDNVQTIDYRHIQQVIESEFKTPLGNIFREFDEVPLAAASIAQVHKAHLTDGTAVVVKVQRPGIIPIIEEDLTILYNLAYLLEKYIPESSVFNPLGMVEEFFRTLEYETNFIIEANNMLRFAQNFEGDPKIKIPKVFLKFTTEKVLVMEELVGQRLSEPGALKAMGIDPLTIVEEGLRAFYKMVFRDGFFHGDLHAGNIFVLPDGRIGLVDFGVVGRLGNRTQEAITVMLLALAQEDYEQLAYEFVEMAPFSEGVNVAQFAAQLRNLMAPYFGLSFKNVQVGKLLLQSTTIAAKHKLILPGELLLFFKAIVTIEGMGRMLVDDFDVLKHTRDFAGDIIKNKYAPEKMLKHLGFMLRDSNHLLQDLPRQIRYILRKINSPGYTKKIQIQEIDSLKHSLETSSNIIFLGLVISALLLSSAIIMASAHDETSGHIPLASTIGFGLAIVLGLLAFYNYFKKG